MAGALLWLALAGALACSDADPGARDAGPAVERAADLRGEGGADLLADLGPIDCSRAPQAPSDRLWPVPGEVMYVQLGLSDLSMGEAALVVGPTGEVILVDTGNDAHDDDVREMLQALVGRVNSTPGFTPHAVDTLDHVLLTHFHSDHADGLEDLLSWGKILGRVVHRGYFDVLLEGKSTVEKLCGALAQRPGLGLALCTGAAAAPCGGTWQGSYPASSCPGLQLGDLTRTGGNGTSYLPLGGSARLELLAVDGVIGSDRYVDLVGAIGDDSYGENARSLVGLLRHGDFTLLISGDLTGGGLGSEDLEGFYRARLGAHVGADGVDVLHVGHHGSKTSTSQGWADDLLPRDGRSRNAVMGVSSGHMTLPNAGPLSTLLDNGRLGQGRAWATTIASGGGTHALLVTATGGHVLVRTLQRGRGYAVQAVDQQGVVMESRAFWSVAACP